MFSPKGMNLDRGWPGRVDGDRVVQLAAQTLQAFFTGGGSAREHAVYPLADVDLRAPVLQPPGIRVFRGGELEFVFANTANVFGPGDAVELPGFELHGDDAHVAVIGADEAVAGYTAGVVWRAPGLPGAKTREYALSLGP